MITMEKKIHSSNMGEFVYFPGAGANILRGIAGAGVLAGADKLKEVYVRIRVGS